MNDYVGKQMRGWDAATFRTASGDPTMRSTVMALAVLEQVPDWQRLRERMDRLTRVVPSLRMRPLYGPTTWSAPRLAVDPDFDLDVHLRRYRMPEGTGWADLLDDARRMSLTDFDLNRPLWEAALVEGLPDGRAAVLLKLHHAIADGQATVMMGMTLFEMAAEPNPDEEPAPPAPDAGDVGVRDITYANVLDNLGRSKDITVAMAKGAVGLVAGTVTQPRKTWTMAWRVVSSIGRATSVPDGPMSPIMDGRGTTYRFGTLEVPFPGLRAAARAEGASVNDAFLAAVAHGMDRYHRRHGVVVDELRVNVPISIRGDAGDRSGRASNAVAIARFPLPIAGLTTSELMESAHELVARWRMEPAMHLADPLADISWVVPVPMLAQAAQASDITTSNVPGPPMPLYLAGARLLSVYPLVATIGAAVNVTMVTYCGTCYIGISTDDRAVTDPAELLDDMRAGFDDVVGSAG